MRSLANPEPPYIIAMSTQTRRSGQVYSPLGRGGWAPAARGGPACRHASRRSTGGRPRAPSPSRTGPERASRRPDAARRSSAGDRAGTRRRRARPRWPGACGIPRAAHRSASRQTICMAWITPAPGRGSDSHRKTPSGYHSAGSASPSTLMSRKPWIASKPPKNAIRVTARLNPVSGANQKAFHRRRTQSNARVPPVSRPGAPPRAAFGGGAARRPAPSGPDGSRHPRRGGGR